MCRLSAARSGTEQVIPVIPVHSEGFRGTKKDGYKAACEALFRLIGKPAERPISPLSINILGDFNLAGETWIIKEYYRQMGVEVVSCITGDGRVDEIGQAHRASLNVVQCSGSMTQLAKMMKETYGIPFERVSYFGIEDTAEALYTVARHFKDPGVLERTEELVANGSKPHLPKSEAIQEGARREDGRPSMSAVLSRPSRSLKRCVISAFRPPSSVPRRATGKITNT